MVQVMLPAESTLTVQLGVLVDVSAPQLGEPPISVVCCGAASKICSVPEEGVPAGLSYVAARVYVRVSPAVTVPGGLTLRPTVMTEMSLAMLLPGQVDVEQPGPLNVGVVEMVPALSDPFAEAANVRWMAALAGTPPLMVNVTVLPVTEGVHVTPVGSVPHAADPVT